MELKVYKNGCPKEAMDIRVAVFVKEQGFRDEFDNIDDIAIHIVLFDGERAIATARAFWDDGSNSYHIGRVAVLREYRRLHLGKRIVEACENEIKKEGGERITISSQVRASGFYEKLGYTKFGEEYLDESCPHIMMEKNI